jgi:hypothetical protein
MPLCLSVLGRIHVLCTIQALAQADTQHSGFVLGSWRTWLPFLRGSHLCAHVRVSSGPVWEHSEQHEPHARQQHWPCRVLREQRLGPCSTSSLESCGVVSGPVASSGPSQFPSPSQVHGSARHDYGSRLQTSASGAVAGTSLAHSSGQVARGQGSPHEDVGYIRVPVTNQVSSDAAATWSDQRSCDSTWSCIESVCMVVQSALAR